jgi:hypothetical protein
VSIDNSKKQNSNPFELPGWVVPTALGLGIPALLVFVPLLVIASLKRRRARRRRHAARARDAAAGAWDELLDRVDELGIASPPPSTRGRTAEALAPRLAAPAEPLGQTGSLALLARRTDDAVFSGRELDDAEVDAVWAEVVATVNATRATLPWWRQLIARYRLASIAAWSRRVVALASTAAPRRPGGGT